MKKFSLILLLAGITVMSSQAQLKYHSNGELTFGTTSLPISSYTTRFEGWGHYLSYGTKFLEICLGPANPRIAGTGDQIVFYNSETSTFNSIQVATVYNHSDRNAKTNIAPINYGIQTVMKLKPVTYEWKNPHDGVTNLKTGKQKGNIGFISQDVEDILPQLVYTDAEGHKLLNYIGLIPVLTKSIQELSVEVKALKAEVARLKSSAVVRDTTASKLALAD